MENLGITVIGGSASSNFGNAPYTTAWPDLLAMNLKDSARVKHHSRGGLTFVKGMNGCCGFSCIPKVLTHSRNGSYID